VTLSRMDLDGTGSPSGLVMKILKAVPGLAPPIQIEEIAQALDIQEIRDVDSQGFEGGLITDAGRSAGFILVNCDAARGRRRFTIGHELGHFLMTHHTPPPSGFRCSREDMRRWSGRGESGAMRMEIEANEFAALILMPPPLWRMATDRLGDPDLRQVITLADRFDVSKEAAARAYGQYHDRMVAVVVSKDGKIDKLYRNVTRFPLFCVRQGQEVPRASLFHRLERRLEGPSNLVEARAEAWLESEWGKPMPELSEQVFFQQGGFALIMLWAEPASGDDEDFDPDADRTASQRMRDREARWR
jgi:Zn-dependent peptidase ImmA (M78 family)